MTRPIARQLQSGPESMRLRQPSASSQTGQKNAYNQVNSIVDDYIAASVALPTPEEGHPPKHGLSEYLSTKRKDSAWSSSPTTTTPSVHAANINFSEALEQLIRSRGSEDREVIMKDIDVMISSYQGMKVTNTKGSHDSWDYGGNRDTLMWLAGDDSYKQDPMVSSREGAQAFKDRPLPPTPGADGVGNLSNHPAFKINPVDSRQEQHRQTHQSIPKNAYAHLLQTDEALSRWSHTSAGSDYSYAASTNRASTNSSQSSNPRSPHPSQYYSSRPMHSASSHLSGPPTLPYEEHDEFHRVQSLPPKQPHTSFTSSLAPTRSETQTNSLPFPPPRLDVFANSPPVSPGESISPTHTPWPGTLQHRPQSPSMTPLIPPQHRFDPIQQDEVAKQSKPSRPRYNLIPNIARKGSAVLNGKVDRSQSFPQPPMTPTTPMSPPPGTPTTARLRHGSVATSVASSNSSISGGIGILPGSRMRNNIIRTDTIESGPVGKEKIMDGRPCKDNNYWGFCKGAWTIREDQKKGISVRTQPSGYYNQKQVWECTSCTFQGEAFSQPHPTKKNKTEMIVDPRIHISMSGIRYRWLFLAKSHVKKKAEGGVKGKDDEYNYCCMFCTADGTLSSVYGGVETLMNHIALTHVADMSENTRKKVNCILGRVAGPKEPFDINMPIFAEEEEPEDI